MDTKTLIAGLIGFFIGGLLVATVATIERGAPATPHDKMGIVQAN